MVPGRAAAWLALAWSVAAGASARADDGGPQPTPARQYLVRCQLSERGDKGTRQVLAAPAVLTTVGKPAEVQVGQEVQPPVAAGKAAAVFSGVTLKATLLRVQESRLVLDTELSITTALDSNDQRTRLVSQTVRNIEPVTLGKSILVPLGDGDEQRLELSVEEAAAGTVPLGPPTAASSPAPAPAPPAADPAPVPSPVAAAQPSSSSGGGNPLRGPLGGIRARLRGR